MNKPYIICHMMTSVDGRIDCAMTAKLAGVDDYYTTLDALKVDATLSGRVTAELEMALPGKFEVKNYLPLGKENFSKKVDSKSYEIVVDTKGTLLWKNDNEYENPHIIITSEKVSAEYISYLDAKNISWIACGKNSIDLSRAVEILAENFNVKRLAIVGGALINGAFLDAGLLDEISILIGLGVDARKGFPAAIDGLPIDREPFKLKLADVKTFDSGAVWLRYFTEN